MDTILIATAFIFGFIARQVGLPPLVGFLTAGFVLNAFGVEKTEILQQLADTGIILLLFSIGLKVKIKNLMAPQVWGTASLHMIITVVLFGAVIYGLSLTGLSYFSGLEVSTCLLISFALSFSSTVFAVKYLRKKERCPQNMDAWPSGFW